MHFTPAGFPSGIPGIGEEIDNAIQQAPHSVRQSIGNVLINVKTASYKSTKKQQSAR